MLCDNCRYYIYSEYGLGEVGYHCRCGFKPFVGLLHTFEPPLLYDCRDCARDALKDVPPVQLSLF